MYGYHRSNSDSLFRAHSTVGDWSSLGKTKLNEPGRQKLASQKSCQQVQPAMLYSDLLCRLRKVEPLIALNFCVGDSPLWTVVIITMLILYETESDGYFKQIASLCFLQLYFPCWTKNVLQALTVPLCKPTGKNYCRVSFKPKSLENHQNVMQWNPLQTKCLGTSQLLLLYKSLP